MRTSEILTKAADLIEERGWTTGSEGWNHTDGSPLCIEGGIMAALGVRFGRLYDENGVEVEGIDVPGTRGASDIIRECPAYNAVHEYLELPEYRDLYAWNDGWQGPRPTAQEVIETLRTVAAIEAAREDVENLTGAQK